MDSELDNITAQDNTISDVVPPRFLSERDIRDELVISEGDGSIEISTDVSPVFSYVLYVNGTHLVKEVRIKNTTEKDIYDLKVKITTDNDMIEPYVKDIGTIPAGQEKFPLQRPDLLAHAPALLSLNESTECLLRVAVIYKGKEIAVHNDKVYVLAHSELPVGDVCDFRILASFVLPNNPAVEKIRQAATEYLKEFSGDSSFDGYQRKDRKRVQQMAAAIFYAIRQKKISYSEIPASFLGKAGEREVFRQKIRFPDEILNTKLGTCMDMALFYAACLEMSGLNPILITIPNHIFAGVWLTDDLSISKQLYNDKSLIEKKVAEGINELIVVECTKMCRDSNDSFDDACYCAQKNLVEVEDYLDIALCRKDQIKPLPIRHNVVIDSSLEQDELSREENNVIAPSIELAEVDIESELTPRTEVTKIQQWERKLLDFSMHNHLLNCRPTGNFIPLMVKDLSEFENRIASGQEFEVAPQPAGLASVDFTKGVFEAMNTMFEYSDIMADALKQSRIYSLWHEEALSKSFTNLYRSSRLSIEENGANSLYLALGILKWFDYTKSGTAAKTPHYAPIIMIPVDFIRKPSNVGYSISFRDDDVLVNRTLLEFLKQQFEMDITGLNPPPEDEAGIDVLKVLTIIRRAIMDRSNWNVLDCALISNFSFAQFMMWNDVHSHADELRQNKIVNSLITGKLEWDATVPSNVDNDDALLPVPVDASQLHAIKMAANDVSFVLHGPPGTGKSQTITAMIANALYKGKTVLFVAEKQAALNVVFRRLRKIGLENFCLELHSNKVQKNHVLSQLKKSVEHHLDTHQTEYESSIKQLKDMREKLDSYVHDLHKPQKCGMSIRELIDAYESIPDYDQKIRIDKKAVNEFTKEDLDKQRELVENLFAAGSAIHDFRNNPLRDVKQTEYSQSLRRQIEGFYDDFCDALDELQKAGTSLAGQLSWNTPNSYSDWKELIDVSRLLTGCSPDEISAENSSRLFEIIAAEKSKISTANSYEAVKNDFYTKYNESVLTADLGAIKARYEDAQKKLFGKQKAMDSAITELQQHLKLPADISLIDKIKADIFALKQAEEDKETAEASAEKIWNGKRDAIAVEAGTFLSVYNQAADKENELSQLLVVTVPNNDNDWIGGKKAYVESLCDNSTGLRDWIIYQSVRSECCANGLETLCNLYEDGFAQEDILPLYFKTVYKELIWQIIDESQTLNTFSGYSFDYRIKQYKQAEEDYLRLTREELNCKLASNVPTSMSDPAVSKEITILKKAISNNGRGMSLRNLFDRIPNILTRLCPCLLMSPMSVAQYLTVDSKKFDLVIFDEASQMPTAQAVGSLARGVNAVIVGDPNQMPPTSFFNSDLTDEGNIQTEDLDSILEDCLALQMPDTHLMWHYRSRHESLIAFSNKNYYEGNMFTFPSVNDRARRVRVCTVNGTYSRYPEKKSDRGKNIREAEAIVNEVKRRYNSPLLHNQTIGIVTFNIRQRDLIKDLIDEECKKDHAFDAWAFPSKYKEKNKDAYADEEEELFVKNLESVQGDERDVILFSIGFGPDEHGKVYYNFGPLNQEGGWKRLNVAVSRSRQEMIVFTSMTSDMIDTNRTSNDGVNQLHDFLKYAETGTLGDDISKENFHAKGITLQICKALEKAGYKTQKNVGSSDLKIDIAVVNPYDENEYLLGILLDGDSYQKAETTRDREVSQQSVLEGLGWNTYRIWTMDWWDSKNKELSKLLEHIETCRVRAEEKAANPSAKDEGPQSEEIQPREIVEDEKKERKKKQKSNPNGDYEGRDKFTVRSNLDE